MGNINRYINNIKAKTNEEIIETINEFKTILNDADENVRNLIYHQTITYKILIDTFLSNELSENERILLAIVLWIDKEKERLGEDE